MRIPRISPRACRRHDKGVYTYRRGIYATASCAMMSPASTSFAMASKVVYLKRLSLLAVGILVLALVCASHGQTSAQLPTSAAINFPDLYEASIAELQDGLERGHFTSVDLVKVSMS